MILFSWAMQRATILAATLAVAMAALSTTATGQAEPPQPPRRPPPDVPAPPLPPRRPAVAPPAAMFGPPMPPRPAAPLAPPSPAMVVVLEDPEVCRRLLSSGKVVARPLPPVAPTLEGCGMQAPVELSAIVLSPIRRVAIEPPATVGCALADAVADWVRQDLDPGFGAPGPLLAALVETSGYACRSRNHLAGAKLSEHAHGNALDIGAMRTAEGTRMAVTGGEPSRLALLKTTACARFATVLGPGSDGFHEHHLHVDLAPRRNGSKICHWDLPQTAHDALQPEPIAPSWNAGRRGPL